MFHFGLQVIKDFEEKKWGNYFPQLLILAERQNLVVYKQFKNRLNPVSFKFQNGYEFGHKMEIDSVINDTIKNRACIVCGAGFSIPRSGKLYCSKRCKQFSFYHREEIIEIKNTKKGINEWNKRE